ncbi:MAG: putative diguanylate cyclase [Microbacteriaceae bacterium]|jgi:hypothetical protein|nr:putative diguanylate cyclase [Microbacteriaceae bacterium]HEV7957379.1 SGNH/GDSL hydrolase family protein [Marisediminicola sp.]
MSWPTAKALLRPYIRARFAGSKFGWSDIPAPTDAPRVFSPGADPDNILLIGDGPAMGFGVTSHNIALPGHIARQLSSLTGRGACVHVVADEGLDVRNVEARFAAGQPERCDAVVVMLGVSDSMRLTALRTWREYLHRFIRRVNRDAPGGVQVVLVAIAPISRMPILRGRSAFYARQHAVLLNRELRTAASGYANVAYLPFAPPSEPDPDRYRSSSTYRKWATHITPTVAELLDVRARTVSAEAAVPPWFQAPERVVVPVAHLYRAAGIAPPWERVWDGERDVTEEPPEEWPWPWNPNGVSAHPAAVAGGSNGLPDSSRLSESN